MEIRQIMAGLEERFPGEILTDKPIPSAWCTNRDNVKAILLGCDPSNDHIKTMPYVFTLGIENKKFNSFKNTFERDLISVGLSWENVYVQNLCKNYFRKQTGQNKKIWNKAALIWLPHIVEELSKFSDSIPVLLTSDNLYNVLVINKENYGETIDFYELKCDIPIKKEDNLLGRLLIPFYRGNNPQIKKSYHLSSGYWNEYAEKINIILKNI